MLTVWSVCNGPKYPDDAVRTLQRMVARNLYQPHVFACLADRAIEDVNCWIPTEQWPGWWAKLALLRLAHGPTLYLDLDCVVVGPLDGLLSRPLSMPANWAESGHGGCQSSVMAWGGDYGWIAETFDPRQIGTPDPAAGHCGLYGPRRLWGDQEYITAVAGDPGAGVVVPMAGVVSYKYHCSAGLPPGARVVAFHGRPKPAEVSDQWVRTALSST